MTRVAPHRLRHVAISCIGLLSLGFLLTGCERLKGPPPPAGVPEGADRDRTTKLWTAVQGEVRTEYYPDGRVARRGKQNLAGKQGEWISYGLDGKTVTSRGEYSNDRKIGKWLYYDDAGKLYLWMQHKAEPINQNLFYINRDYGTENGPYERYYPDGKLEERGRFVAGLHEGRVERFYQDGKLAMAGEYRGDKREGHWRFYYPGGNLEREEHYRAGKLHGEARNFHPDGSLYHRSEYNEGTRESLSLLP